MKKKITFLLIIVMMAFIGLSVVSAVDTNDSSNNVTISIASQKPMAIGDFVNSIKTSPSFKTYDQNILGWLNEFNSSHVVLSTDEYYIIMNSSDASKMSTEKNIGILSSCNISCHVLENKSMGTGLAHVLHVDNVDVISNDSANFVFS